MEGAIYARVAVKVNEKHHANRCVGKRLAHPSQKREGMRHPQIQKLVGSWRVGHGKEV
jgi:hypothetical protein